MGLRREGRGFPGAGAGWGGGGGGARGAGRLVADSVAYTDEYVSAWIGGALLTR